LISSGALSLPLFARVRLFRRFTCLCLLLALNEFGAISAVILAPVTPPSHETSSIVAAHPGDDLPFIGESGATLDIAGFGSSRSTRHIPRLLRALTGHGACDAPADRALCHLRVAQHEFLSFARALVLIRTGALSATTTTKPPPVA
jgi:hypothetical protein